MPAMLPEIDAAVPLINPLLMVPPAASDIPRPVADAMLPSFVMIQLAAFVPSMPSLPGVTELTAPVAVTTKGLSSSGFDRVTGPETVVLIVPISFPDAARGLETPEAHRVSNHAPMEPWSA